VTDIFKERVDKVRESAIPKIKYKINNFGHRSEDFAVLDKNKTNILYAGCSMAFGEYLPEGYSWQYHLHKDMSKKFNTSVPVTLSYPGGSVEKIIDNIYKYINLFGKPEYIFLLLPDLFRTNWPRPEGDIFTIKMKHQNELENSNTMSEHSMVYCSQAYYRSFEIFCSQLGIKLYTSSWDDETSHILSALDLSNYGNMDLKGEDDFVMNLSKKDLEGYDKDFLISAGDSVHAGVITSMYFAKHFSDRVGL
jgi:hypothetical protein